MVRKNGAISVLRAIPEHDIKEVIVSRPANMEVGRHALRQLLDSGHRFDAIICSSDTLAQGAIMEAEAQGLRVPDDFSVIGFADLNFAAHNRPAITTVSVEKWDLGIRAADMLADKIEGITVEEPIVDMGYRLVIRESA